MDLVDARRLTGPSHLARVPLVLVELKLDPGDTLSAVESAFFGELARMRDALGLGPMTSPVIRPHRGGLVIGYEAPLDTMLANVDVSEWAALSARAVLLGGPPAPLEPRRSEIAQTFADDARPRLLALQAAASEHDVPFYADDDLASAGEGKHSRTWPLDALPEPADVPWRELGRVPVALVTGTNGKTTSTRLLAHLVAASGAVVGSSSSDAVTIGARVVEEGDWSGPAAARVVLRDRAVDVAILETARGGILRRGLAVASCDAALITNVSDDHMGGYGIDDLDAMVRVKGVIAEAVKDDGTIVLNAADPKLVELAARLRPSGAGIVYFADLDHAGTDARDVVREHRARGGRAVFARGGDIVAATGNTEHVVASEATCPITFGGAARYNVQNVAAAIAMARALGVDDATIAGALRTFTMAENAGRGELVERNGVRIFLDFAHNPDGIKAVLDLTSVLLRERPGRLFVITGSAGDRSDHEIAEMARLIAEAKPHRVLVREVEGYLRGRAPLEVPEMFRRELTKSGLPEGDFILASSEVDALERALTEAKQDDLVALLIHLDRGAVRAFLQRA